MCMCVPESMSTTCMQVPEEASRVVRAAGTGYRGL